MISAQKFLSGPSSKLCIVEMSHASKNIIDEKLSCSLAKALDYWTRLSLSLREDAAAQRALPRKIGLLSPSAFQVYNFEFLVEFVKSWLFMQRLPKSPGPIKNICSQILMG